MGSSKYTNPIILNFAIKRTDKYHYPTFKSNIVDFIWRFHGKAESINHLSWRKLSFESKYVYIHVTSNRLLLYNYESMGRTEWFKALLKRHSNWSKWLRRVGSKSRLDTLWRFQSQWSIPVRHVLEISVMHSWSVGSDFSEWSKQSCLIVLIIGTWTLYSTPLNSTSDKLIPPQKEMISYVSITLPHRTIRQTIIYHIRHYGEGLEIISITAISLMITLYVLITSNTYPDCTTLEE